jgi:uncharacterized protein YbcV (DUF1398 family)
VQRLVQAGFERYHSDLSRHEKTFYLPSGESQTVSDADRMEHAGIKEQPIPEHFDSNAVCAALSAIQQQQIGYAEFLRQIMAAGTADYFVYLTGKRVHYVGRNGEIHTEWFPGAQH